MYFDVKYQNCWKLGKLRMFKDYKTVIKDASIVNIYPVSILNKNL